MLARSACRRGLARLSRSVLRAHGTPERSLVRGSRDRLARVDRAALHERAQAVIQRLDAVVAQRFEIGGARAVATFLEYPIEGWRLQQQLDGG